jgi:hypothetical protein
MGNSISTITIVLVGIAVILLILVGFLLYRIRRLRRLHQVELDTLMGIASNARVFGSRIETDSPGLQATRSVGEDPAAATPAPSIRPPPAEPAPEPTAKAAGPEPDIPKHSFGSCTDGINVEEINVSDLDIGDPHGRRGKPGHPSRFDEDRIFFQASLEDGLEQGWYFTGFGERPHGPFADRESATRVMMEMHEQLTNGGLPAGQEASGGRKIDKKMPPAGG